MEMVAAGCACCGGQVDDAGCTNTGTGEKERTPMMLHEAAIQTKKRYVNVNVMAQLWCGL
jgi:hypothetical protein